MNPNSWSVSCDELNQFDTITLLPEEILVLIAIPFLIFFLILFQKKDLCSTYLFLNARKNYLVEVAV